MPARKFCIGFVKVNLFVRKLFVYAFVKVRAGFVKASFSVKKDIPG